MNIKYNDLENKVIVITGAGRGIGKAIAQSFAEDKSKLSLISQSENVYKTADSLSTETISFKGDVSDHSFCKQAMADTIKRFGQIDVLVNAAAIIGPTGEVHLTQPEDWSKTIQVNLIGTYNMTKEALNVMIPNKIGKIINFAGGGAAYAFPNFSAYACSKAAAVRFTETVAEEMRANNIQINIIAPGANDTDMLDQVRAAGGDVRTIVSIDKPIALVRFLASDKSGSITAKFIHVYDEYTNFHELNDESMYTLRRIEP